MYSSPSVMVWMVPLGPNQKLAGMLAGLDPLASENQLAWPCFGGKQQRAGIFWNHKCFQQLSLFPRVKNRLMSSHVLKASVGTSRSSMCVPERSGMVAFA